MADETEWFGDGYDQLDRAAQEAVVWFATLESGEATPADRAAFAAWLARDPSHPQKFAEIKRLWEGAPDLPEAKRRRRTSLKAMTRRNLGKAAIVGLAAGGAWWTYAQRFDADFRTAKGERRSVRLPDGSTAELSTETAMSLAFDDRGRRIALHYGEAFFDVVHDPRRPLSVNAGSGQIVAVGTRFSVGERDDAVEVAVEDGAVEVRLARSSASVARGNRTSYRALSLGAVSPIDPETAFAWRDGRLAFVSQRLEDVVAVLNRWRPGRIVVMSPSLAARPVTMIVDVGRIDDALASLAAALPARIVTATRYLAVIVAA